MALLVALLLQAELIEKLGADELLHREEAESGLLKLGEKALPELQKALGAEKDEEVRGRIKRVMRAIRREASYGRRSGEWKIRLERDVVAAPSGFDQGIMPLDRAHPQERYVEIRGIGTGVVVLADDPSEVFVLEPSTAQIEDLIHRAMAADLMNLGRASIPARKGPTWQLQFWAACDGNPQSFGDLLPDDLRAIVRDLQRAFEKPESWRGRSVQSLLEALDGKDAEAAEKALTRAPAVVELYLREARHQGPDAVAARIERILAARQDPGPLVEGLRSDDVAVRDAAERDLVKLGEPALPALRKALDAEKETEARARLASVIAKIEKPIRYGRGKTTWRMRVTFEAKQPEPRTWFAEIAGDGGGAAVPWGREERAFALSPTREQLDEAIELAMAANVLDGDFSTVESPDRVAPGVACVLRFENGAQARTIHVRAARDAIPEELRKLLYFLQGPFSDPAKMKGREAGELAADLRGPGAEAAAKALRRIGKPAVAPLKRALSAEKEEAVRERLGKLIEELQK